MNKKASIQDIIFWAVMLSVVGVMVLIAFKVTASFNTEIQANNLIPTKAKAAANTMVGHYSGVIDNTFLFLAIGMAIGTLILASLVRIHPMFIPFFIIAMGFVIVLSGIFSNIYTEMASTPELAAEASQLTFISNILTYLPIITGIIGFTLMVVLYKSWKVAQFE